MNLEVKMTTTSMMVLVIPKTFVPWAPIPGWDVSHLREMTITTMMHISE